MTTLWRWFCVVVSMLSVVYLAGWLANSYTPSSIDSGVQTVWSQALLTNLGLLGLLALQHSGMARNTVKRYAGRPAYLLAMALVFGVMFVFWEPMPAVVWRADGAAAVALRLVQAAGGVLASWSVAITNAGTLFGLSEEGPFQVRGPYRWARHPMMTGTLAVLWAFPETTVGRLLFNTFMTVYVLAAIRWEERDLAARFGPGYDAYRAATPALFRLPMQ